MAAVRILNLDPEYYSEEARAILRSVGCLEEKKLSRAQLLAEIKHYTVVVMRFAHCLDEEVLAAAESLRLIGTNVTGLDHIDVGAARRRGVSIVSLKGEYGLNRTVWSTAEHTWALLLALVRHILPAVESVRKGCWDRNAFVGSELCDKRLGIVGFGRIGARVAEYGLAFSMNVYAYTLYPVENRSNVTFCTSLSELLTKSDILTLHVPLDEGTVDLIGEKELLLLPKGAFLVNTSRGRVVTEQGLISVLASGHLAGAAIDVLAGEEREGFLDQSALLAYARSHRNLLITPHIGGATREAWRKTEVYIARKIASYFGLSH